MRKLSMLVIILFTISCSKKIEEECDCSKYNKYIIKKELITEHGVYHEKKIKICHNGNTIEVSPQAVQAHLDHGDILGDCVTLSDSEWEYDPCKVWCLEKN